MIDRQIQEARAAAQQVAEQDALREKAAQLPTLEAEAERAREQEAAQRHLQESAQRVQERLAAVQPKIKAWRERLGAVLLEGQELVDQLPLLENVIAGSAKELAGAYRAVEEAGHPRSYFTDVYQVQARQRAQAIPDELVGTSSVLSALWRQAGGADADLNALGDGVAELLDSDLGRVLRSAIERRTFVYTPSRADRFVGRF